MTELEKLLVLEKDARGFGFDWPNQQMIIDQAIDECREIEEDIVAGASADKVQEEIGDLLHAAISLCTYSGFSVQETLEKTNKKFGKRMQAIKKLTYKHGLENLKGQSIDFMLELWKEAKK